MYSKIKITDKVRVPPNLFKDELEEAIKKVIMNEYEGTLTKDGHMLLLLDKISEIGDGAILPEDGAVYYETNFEMISWRPELQDVIEGKITEIREFGIFVRIGPVDGLVHMSQVMDDFVSYSEGGVVGKNTKEVLKIGDDVRTRIVAISMKGKESTKIGLTMRQQGLGKIDSLDKKTKPKKVEVKNNKKK